MKPLLLLVLVACSHTREVTHVRVVTVAGPPCMREPPRFQSLRWPAVNDVDGTYHVPAEAVHQLAQESIAAQSYLLEEYERCRLARNVELARTMGQTVCHTKSGSEATCVGNSLVQSAPGWVLFPWSKWWSP